MHSHSSFQISVISFCCFMFSTNYHNPSNNYFPVRNCPLIYEVEKCDRPPFIAPPQVRDGYGRQQNATWNQKHIQQVKLILVSQLV